MVKPVCQGQDIAIFSMKVVKVVTFVTKMQVKSKKVTKAQKSVERGENSGFRRECSIRFSPILSKTFFRKVPKNGFPPLI